LQPDSPKGRLSFVSEVPPYADLVSLARDFAVSRHAQIGHRRKYTNVPYSEHLQHVADLVASVTNDPEMLAAAWLHDVVEDTTATLEDVESAFGKEVGRLVESLTDVSKPGDGNREARKAIDRKHLSTAEARAKTVKLADLIDNCEDIARHDPKFARVYLREMAALLEVLREGDGRLYDKATQVYTGWANKLGLISPPQKPSESQGPPVAWHAFLHLSNLFRDAFRAQDIAEPLRSFDIERPCNEVQPVLETASLGVIGLRSQGVVCGYARTADLADGYCKDHLRPFRPGQAIHQQDSLADVIHVLTICEHAFLSAFGEIVGVIGRGDINKPIARMWLFGIVTLAEMELTRLVDAYYPEESWHTHLPDGRLDKAKALHQERLRRQQPCRLVECLQLSDKGQLLVEHTDGLKLFGLKSKREGKRVVKEFESLRNNLAHGQDIAVHDWAPIARIASRVSEVAAIKSMTGRSRSVIPEDV